MTLFEAVSDRRVFGRVLDTFYSSVRDTRTLRMISDSRKESGFKEL
jgi:uncharacterized protein (DUF1810 family)